MKRKDERAYVKTKLRSRPRGGVPAAVRVNRRVAIAGQRSVAGAGGVGLFSIVCVGWPILTRWTSLLNNWDEIKVDENPESRPWMTMAVGLARQLGTRHIKHMTNLPCGSCN